MLDIPSLLSPYDSLDLECDGMTRVLHVVLTREKVPHTCYVGFVEAGNQEIPFHFWILLEDGRTVDYRLRMWLKGDRIPHGVFLQEDYPEIRYEGREHDLGELPPIVFELLTLGMLSTTLPT